MNVIGVAVKYTLYFAIVHVHNVDACVAAAHAYLVTNTADTIEFVLFIAPIFASSWNVNLPRFVLFQLIFVPSVTRDECIRADY